LAARRVGRDVKEGNSVAGADQACGPIEHALKAEGELAVGIIVLERSGLDHRVQGGKVVRGSQVGQQWSAAQGDQRPRPTSGPASLPLARTGRIWLRDLAAR
jgi:hypothetical protein